MKFEGVLLLFAVVLSSFSGGIILGVNLGIEASAELGTAEACRSYTFSIYECSSLEE